MVGKLSYDDSLRSFLACYALRDRRFQFVWSGVLRTMASTKNLKQLANRTIDERREAGACKRKQRRKGCICSRLPKICKLQGKAVKVHQKYLIASLRISQ